MSIEIISPSFKIISLLGIPCTNTSFTDAQIAPGNPWYPLKEHVACWDKINFSANSSNSFVDIPGLMNGLRY